VRTEYVLVSSEQRFQAVRDGRIDILCDPSSVTLARREMVDFSLPTFLDGASVLSRSIRPVQRFEDLAGKRVGVLAGTTTEQVLHKSLDDLGLRATIVPVSDHRAGVDLLSGDKLDAYRRSRHNCCPAARGRAAGFAAQQPLLQLRDLRAGAAARRRRVPADG
jgi:ABC-type amino acid transport substrate-binding protein